MDNIYKVITLVGSSPESWEKAASDVVEQAAAHLQDMRIAEVEEMDMHLSEGAVVAYRVKLKVSFKYHAKQEM